MPWNYAAAAGAGALLGPSILGGSKGSAGASEQTITNQNPISAAAQPYIENMLGRADTLSQTPYQAYPGQRTADFTGLQNQSFQGAQNLGVIELSLLYLSVNENAPHVAIRYQGEFGSRYQSHQGVLEIGKTF